MNFLSIKRDKIFDVTCILSIYIFSLHVMIVGLQYQILGSILAIPYIIFRAKHFRYDNNGLVTYFIYSLITIIFSVFNIFFTNNGIGGSLILVANLSLALYCIDNLNKLKIHILIILWINMLYIVYQILYLGMIPNEIYEKLGLSRNHGGLLLCLFAGFYCYIKKITTGEGSILIPLLSIFCAYLLVGRSSLGLLIALFFVSVIAKGKINVIVLIFLFIVMFLVYFREEIVFLYEASSFAENGMESSRYKIWDSYFNNLTITSTLFGLETIDIPVLRDYGGNPHNSFLNFHRRFGFIPILLFFIISCASMFKYLKSKDYYLFFIMLIIYSRIFFDSDCFIGPYDYILYTIVFYPLIQYKPIFKMIRKEKSVSVKL